MTNSTDKLLHTLQQNIKFYREQKNITQLKLSILANISQDYISEIERGKRTPSIKRLMSIAKVLNVEVYQFFVEIAKD